MPVIVNDRFDLALAAGAAGVHLGPDDVPVVDVRRVTPPEFIIGASVGCDAEIANSELADYVGIGPLYETSSKRDAGNAIGIAEFARLARATGKPGSWHRWDCRPNRGSRCHSGRWRRRCRH